MPDLNYGTGIAARRFPRRMTVLSQQIDLCRTLLRSLAGDNPFYKRKFDEAGTSYSVRNLVDFAESVPLTRRQELLEDARTNPPWGTNLSLPIGHYRFVHLAGRGQLEAPCQLHTPESWESFLANGAEVFVAAGVAAGDRIFFASCFEERPGGQLSMESGARANGLCVSGAGLATPAQWDVLLRFEAAVLCGGMESLIGLADSTPTLDASVCRIRLIVGDGRPEGAAHIRNRLVPKLPEARFYNHYALPETGAVACECPARPGSLHVLEPGFIAETIDPATGHTVDPGQVGELVLTTLFRSASPLVRYRTGDLVRISPETLCECGRSYTTLEGGILGSVGA
jgi:phenylacetate-CoA ligase